MLLGEFLADLDLTQDIKFYSVVYGTYAGGYAEFNSYNIHLQNWLALYNRDIVFSHQVEESPDGVRFLRIFLDDWWRK